MRRLPVRTRFAVMAGSAIGWISRVLGRGAGATISGRVMIALDPRALRRLATGMRVWAVSGTNGKTTTTRFLATAMRASGHDLISNTSGANLASGLVAALARARTERVAVLEIDEGVLPTVIDDLAAELIVLTNLTRDQLDRYSEVRTLAEKLRRAFEGHAGLKIVANARDPLVVWAAGTAATTWVDAGTSWTLDATACPACGSLLGWDDDRFSCPCGFAEPSAAAVLSAEVLQTPHGSVRITSALPGRWNIANAAFAVAACEQLGAHAERAAASIAEVADVGGRYSVVALPDGRSATIILAKNPAGWSEVIGYLADRSCGVVIAVNSEAADGRDTSWLWDVPFERLHGHSLAAAGRRAHDVAVRLHYGGMECVVEPDALLAAARVAGDEIYVVPSYSAFVDIAPVHA